MADDERPRIPCQTCGEQISVDATECPHCEDKKMTSGRYRLYVFLIIPAIAAVLSMILYPMFNSATPEVTPAWFGGMFILLYIIGVIFAKQYRDDYVEHLRESGKRAAKRDGGN